MSNPLTTTVSHVVMTPELMTLLGQKPKGRFSRSDAYFDLLGRAMANKPLEAFPMMATEEQRVMFRTSLTDLAKKWGWQRATVRRFLAELSAIGQIEREDDYRSIDIEFTALRYKEKDNLAGNDSTTISQQTNADSCANKHEDKINLPMSLFDSVNNERYQVYEQDDYVRASSVLSNKPVSEASQEQMALCRQLYDELYNDMSEHIRTLAYTQQVAQAIYNAYFIICGGDGAVWHKHIDQAKASDNLCLTVYGDKAMDEVADAIEKYIIRFGHAHVDDTAQTGNKNGHY